MLRQHYYNDKHLLVSPVSRPTFRILQYSTLFSLIPHGIRYLFRIFLLLQTCVSAVPRFLTNALTGCALSLNEKICRQILYLTKAIALGLLTFHRRFFVHGGKKPKISPVSTSVFPSVITATLKPLSISSFSLERSHTISDRTPTSQPTLRYQTCIVPSLTSPSVQITVSTGSRVPHRSTVLLPV